MEHIWKLQEFVSVTTKLQMDSSEFAYLKAAVLFSPGEKKFFKRFPLLIVRLFVWFVQAV